jgi:hypothetical protein
VEVDCCQRPPLRRQRLLQSIEGWDGVVVEPKVFEGGEGGEGLDGGEAVVGDVQDLLRGGWVGGWVGVVIMVMQARKRVHREATHYGSCLCLREGPGPHLELCERRQPLQPLNAVVRQVELLQGGAALQAQHGVQPGGGRVCVCVCVGGGDQN